MKFPHALLVNILNDDKHFIFLARPHNICMKFPKKSLIVIVGGATLLVAPKVSTDACYALNYKNIFIAHTSNADDGVFFVSRQVSRFLFFEISYISSVFIKRHILNCQSFDKIIERWQLFDLR